MAYQKVALLLYRNGVVVSADLVELAARPISSAFGLKFG